MFGCPILGTSLFLCQGWETQKPAPVLPLHLPLPLPLPSHPQPQMPGAPSITNL